VLHRAGGEGCEADQRQSGRLQEEAHRQGLQDAQCRNHDHPDQKRSQESPQKVGGVKGSRGSGHPFATTGKKTGGQGKLEPDKTASPRACRGEPVFDRREAVRFLPGGVGKGEKGHLQGDKKDDEQFQGGKDGSGVAPGFRNVASLRFMIQLPQARPAMKKAISSPIHW